MEILKNNCVVSSGIVDDVTDDGAILWLSSPVVGRRLFEKAEHYEAWAAEERIGFHYDVHRIEAESASSRI